MKALIIQSLVNVILYTIQKEFSVIRGRFPLVYFGCDRVRLIAAVLSDTIIE